MTQTKTTNIFKNFDCIRINHKMLLSCTCKLNKFGLKKNMPIGYMSMLTSDTGYNSLT